MDKNLKMVSLKVFKLLILVHIKSKGIKNLFSKLKFYGVTIYVL